MAKTDIKSLFPEEISAMLSEMGEPSFRGKQIFKWLHEKRAENFDEMTDIPLKLRDKLKGEVKISNVNIVEKVVSSKDNTVKYLFGLDNDNIIESVLMDYSFGSSVCVSTQAGCRMGCSFCASTLSGLSYNLLPGEMLSEVYKISKDTGKQIKGVVLMGSGEPLDNYENTLRFIKLINSPDGMNLGQRHITLSTCGLVDKIYMLAEEELQITLAVSLHAPNDEIRNSLMPISKKHKMDDLLLACKRYADRTKRRITFEYALIKNVNDNEKCAYELAERLKNMLCHVNLIPINDVKERNYVKSSYETIQNFARILELKGIETTVRRKLGSDINAACGQLRKGYMDRKK
ncbi:MAG: 23S rRNA (adenine(2503)-C(2))-methyltransferase RlmN [Lachnospiraceae bacterium]|nr:23S rRNA (adenine(2503)-C(2))-methyltransferase RlmN [Lachnospiraceae bacterium]